MLCRLLLDDKVTPIVVIDNSENTGEPSLSQTPRDHNFQFEITVV